MVKELANENTSVTEFTQNDYLIQEKRDEIRRVVEEANRASKLAETLRTKALQVERQMKQLEGTLVEENIVKNDESNEICHVSLNA